MSALVRNFRVGQQVTAAPSSVWRRFGSVGAIRKSDFFDYYRGHHLATAIGVENAVRFAEPLPLAETLGVARPPQSFQYLNIGPSELQALHSGRLANA